MRRAPTSTEEFKRRPKTARKSEIDTKTKLLNAAERLFSDKGIEAISHRDIALAAAVNLAALNYHFGSRQAFIRAVIKGCEQEFVGPPIYATFLNATSSVRVATIRCALSSR